jgi:hypothetical protein
MTASREALVEGGDEIVVSLLGRIWVAAAAGMECREGSGGRLGSVRELEEGRMISSKGHREPDIVIHLDVEGGAEGMGGGESESG